MTKNESNQIREQILRTGNGRFFFARIHEDAERRYFVTLVQARTFKGRDQHFGAIAFNAEELQVVCDRLRAYADGLERRTLGVSFPGRADRDAWLLTPDGTRTFFHIAARKSGELFLIISRRPQPGGRLKEALVFRYEVDPLIAFLEEHAAALTTLSQGNLPAGFPTSAGVIEVLSFEAAIAENEDEEYSEEEQGLLDRCEGYPGLIELAEERIQLARRLDELETSTGDPELTRLEMAAATLGSEAQAPELRRPDEIFTERERLVRKFEMRRDDIPAFIEEEIATRRQRLDEIDGILAQEFEREQSFRREDDDSDREDEKEDAAPNGE